MWPLSHPLGIYDRHRYDFDYSKDYVQEHERTLEEQRQRINQE
ncbi:MAG TPA: hypothetical protein VFA32_10040 [Dehalococcoidia bacterium]|nr:hypothetical protein [Dehalococcoidia bacterium]